MDDYIAERLTKSTAALKEVPKRKALRESVAEGGLGVSATKRATQTGKPHPPMRGDANVSGAGTQARPVDTNTKPRGRPRTGFDKKAYDKERMKKARAALKAKRGDK